MLNTEMETVALPSSGRPPLRRVRSGRVLTGVARGVAAHLGIRPIWVRLIFVFLSIFNGIGALIYVALWAVLPSDRSSKPYMDRKQWPVFAVLGVGLFIVTLNLAWDSPGMLFGWLAALVALGAGVIWRQVKPDTDWLETLMGTGSRQTAVLRLGGGGILVAAGVIGAIVILADISGDNLANVVNSVVFTVIALAGVAVVFGPLGWRMVTELRTEREGRVREAERADIAAMVHDQVLHTLALIQRRADDPREVVRLSRGQERALRNWLYKPTAEAEQKFSAALEAVAAEIEDSFALEVDSVVVGDCDMDPHVAALVAAAREAMVNAAKHAGVGTISLYAEAEPEQLSVFVRDRGAGFDPDHIDSDRHGVRGSIMDRMVRHGGKAEVRSTVGEGTEVRLSMPREQESS